MTGNRLQTANRRSSLVGYRDAFIFSPAYVHQGEGRRPLGVNEKTAQDQLQMVFDQLLDIELLQIAEQDFPDGGVDLRANQDQRVDLFDLWTKLS